MTDQVSYKRTNELLGRGAYGEVWKGISNETNQFYALKYILRKRIDDDVLKREIRNQREFNHSNILTLFDVIKTESHYVLVLELCRDDLKRHLNSTKWNENDARRWFREICIGVSHMHEVGVCHRDLKLENLLINDKGKIKISDFGLSKLLTNDQMCSSFVGTRVSMAPELFRNQNYSFPADIWSLGIVLYYLLYRKYPHENVMDVRSVERSVLNCEQFEFKEMQCSKDGIDLVKKILVYDPEQRIKMNEILNHPWLKIDRLSCVGLTQKNDICENQKEALEVKKEKIVDIDDISKQNDVEVHLKHKEMNEIKNEKSLSIEQVDNDMDDNPPKIITSVSRGSTHSDGFRADFFQVTGDLPEEQYAYSYRCIIS